MATRVKSHSMNVGGKYDGASLVNDSYVCSHHYRLFTIGVACQVIAAVLVVLGIYLLTSSFASGVQALSKPNWSIADMENGSSGSHTNAWWW
ncbi:MAG: hypothetical protein KDA47_22890, partial [Planctomycetales bacterium]|nr:hypothetical protein [Planctomycetales bacterium]